MHILGFAASIALFVAAVPAQAVTVSIPARSDATLYDDPSGLLANGSGVFVFAGMTAGGLLRRTLMDFDIAASVPAGAHIVTAELRLNVSRSLFSSPLPTTLHRVLASWTEGPSAPGLNEGGGTLSGTGDVTWIHRSFPGSLWTNPGGDFAAVASGVSPTPSTGTAIWPSSTGMVADVQGWLDNPATNFGWLFRTDEQNFLEVRRYDGRLATVVRNRPSLIVTYVTPGNWASVGQGCGTPAPSLAVTGTLIPGTTFGLALQANLPGAPAANFLAMDLVQPAISFGGCNLFLDPALAVSPGISVLDGTGQLVNQYAVPNLASFSGFHFAAQGAVLDLLAAAGFRLSNAVYMLWQ